MFAYRSSFFRRATIGEEYPTTFLDGELGRTLILILQSENGTRDIPDGAEKSAVTLILQNSSNLINNGQFIETVRTYWTVSSGSATPVLVKHSQPATRSMNSGFGISEPNAIMASLAACGL